MAFELPDNCPSFPAVREKQAIIFTSIGAVNVCTGFGGPAPEEQGLEHIPTWRAKVETCPGVCEKGERPEACIMAKTVLEMTINND